MNSVKTCNIIPEDSDNVSDHLPVRIEFSLSLERNQQQPKNPTQIAQPKWNNTLTNEKYLQITSDKLSQLGRISFPTSRYQDIKSSLNDRFEKIHTILIDAASEAGCVPHKHLKPKTYLRPELSSLRDKKRIWWSMWV